MKTVRVMKSTDKAATTESLASSKQSKTSRSTNTSKKSSTSSSNKSKSLKSVLHGKEKKKRKKDTQKKNSESARVGTDDEPRRQASLKRSKGARQKSHSKDANKSATIIISPPPEISAYLVKVVQGAVASSCNHAITDGPIDLLEIRLYLSQSTDPDNRPKSTRMAMETPMMFYLKKSRKKKKQKTLAPKVRKTKDRQNEEKKNKKKSSRRKEGKYKSGEAKTVRHSKKPSSRKLEARIGNRKSSSSQEAISFNDSGNSHELLSAAESRSTEAESNATPLIDNIHQQSNTITGHNDTMNCSMGQEMFHDKKCSPSRLKTNDTQVLPTLKPPKSPRMAMELSDEEATNILPPPHPSALDQESLHGKPPTQGRIFSRTRSKLNMVVKKTTGRAFSSSKKKSKETKTRAQSEKASMRWKRLHNENERGREGEAERNQRDGGTEDKSKCSLDSWVIQQDKDPSESSDFAMSTFSNWIDSPVKTGREESSFSSSKENGSMYTGGGARPQSSRRSVIASFSGSSADKDVEYDSSSSSNSESYVEEEYHSEDSWDEEEVHASPDEGGYMSPEEESHNVLPDASEYISPIGNFSRQPLRVSVQEAQDAKRQYYRQASTRNNTLRLSPPTPEQVLMRKLF